MGKHYNQTPSEVLRIRNDYLAYCIDEVAFYLESEITNDEGQLLWQLVRWEDDIVVTNNNKLVDFIKGGE